MEIALIQALRDSQSHIRTRWEVLLRQEQTQTVLASPDLLVRLFDGTLATVFDRLKPRVCTLAGPLTLSSEEIRAKCACGRNPLLAYYSTAEHVLLETLMKLEAVTQQKYPGAADELRSVIRHVSFQEIETFCSVCQYRPDRQRSISDTAAS